MNSQSKRNFLASALASTAAGALALPAWAQQDARQDPRRPLGNVLTLACCKCVGTAMTYPLNTGLGPGTAPWKLLGGPTAVVAAPHPNWAAAAPAQWIGPGTNAGSAANPGPYVYELRIWIPKCIVPVSLHIQGQYAGDDVPNLTVTGPGSYSASAPTGNYATLTAFSFTTGLITGPSWVVLKAKVVNANLGQNPTGLLINGTITQRCATDRPGPVEIDPPIDKKD